MSRKTSLCVDLKLVEIIALGGNQSEAARAAGCCRRTVHRRLRDPHFVQRVDEFRAAMRNLAAQKLIAGMADSRARLSQAMQLGSRGKFSRNFKKYLKELSETISLLPHVR